MTASNANSSADRSQRFVLPDDSPLLRSMTALWVAEPGLARQLESLEPASGAYTLEPARSGEPTLALPTPEGRRIYLHSRYQPSDEAARQIDGIDVTEAGAYYVQGFGLGYHVRRLFDRTGDDTLICVFEPNLTLLRTAFEHQDFSSLIESRRVLWFVKADKAELFTRLNPWLPTITIGFSAIAHPPSLQVEPAFHDQVRVLVEELKAYAGTTVNTLVLNGRRTAENLARNVPWYVAAPGVSRLKGQYKQSPAIIVSAGPSLRKNKHLLKEAKGRAVIVAVQTTLQPLLELGIEPDFVTSLDYHDISTRFWEKLPKTINTELVAEPKASSAIFDLNPGPLSLLGNDFAEKLLSEMKLNKPRLPSGATVAHLAYYVAEHLGCDPIIFVGQDLGFSDGLCYAPGTSYEDVWRPELSRFCTVEMKQWEQIVRDRHILRRVPDHQGQPMYTEERLFTYLQHFERDFARSRTRIIDATEGGVLKRGTTSMTLRQALDQFCGSPLPAGKSPHLGMDWSRLGDCVISLQNRRTEAEQIERLARETLPLLEEVRDHLADQGRVNRAIARIDVLRARISELSSCYTLIMQLSQKSELQRFRADQRISATKADGYERQRMQVQRDIDNVRSVIETAAEFQSLMRDTIERVGQFSQAPLREAA